MFSIVAMTSLAGAMPGPASEVKATATVKLPAVPDFALPPTTDGVHDPQELRVRGASYFEKDLQVTGYVIWIYDCIADVRKPGETRAATQKRLDEDPTLCERSKLYLGTDKTTPLEKGLWVVDVPRPPNKLELERLPQEKLDAWPQVPKIRVGDYVTITGHFATSSPHKERNSDGLLVFQSIAPAKRLARGKRVAMPLQAGTPPAVPAAPPAVALGDPRARNGSIVELNQANKLLGTKQIKEAIEHYAAAEKLDAQNHLAWYGDGIAHIELHDFAPAVAALEHSAALAPDQPMYQMWDGIAMYESDVEDARVAQAKASGRDPADVTPDLDGVDLSNARRHLEIALAIEPKLWRAHYYLGRIWRAQGAARDAATEFTKAIEDSAHEWGPYVALAELYRKWDYTDAAIVVADAGTRNASEGTSDLFYVLGMAYDEKHRSKQAIDAFTLALAAQASNHKARFQRGQTYFKAGKKAEAKADLEAFVAAAPPALSFARSQASQMLEQLR